MGIMSKPVLALASAGGVAAFLGLAILGWGGFDAFFANPARIALVVATAAMVVAGLLSSANLSTGEREDRSNRWIIGALGLVGLLSAWLPAYTDRKEFWVLDGDAVRWLGVALYVGGGALRLWPVFILGRRFSGLVAIQPGHMLVTDGLYSRIRNPSYLGLLILSLGWALAFRSGAGVLLAVLNIPPLIARMNSEERLLHAQFGQEYEAYRARTWRLLPGLY
jgi:protein-S-isoprenylcysteine O-methyltransferase Ste14